MWVEVLHDIDHVWSSKQCVYCACEPSVRLDAPSIMFSFCCFLYVVSYLLIKEFESWITGVCSPYGVSLCNSEYYVVGYEPVC